MLGTRQRMARNEVNAGRDMRCHLGDNRGLGRSDIGDDGTGLQATRNGLRHVTRCADRNGDDDEICIARCFSGVRCIAVTEAKGTRLVKRFYATRRDGNLPCEACTADGMGKRRADQANADQRDAVETGRTHLPVLMKSFSAANTPRLASSLPIVMRKASGNP